MTRWRRSCRRGLAGGRGHRTAARPRWRGRTAAADAGVAHAGRGRAARGVRQSALSAECRRAGGGAASLPARQLYWVRPPAATRRPRAARTCSGRPSRCCAARRSARCWCARRRAAGGAAPAPGAGPGRRYRGLGVAAAARAPGLVAGRAAAGAVAVARQHAVDYLPQAPWPVRDAPLQLSLGGMAHVPARVVASRCSRRSRHPHRAFRGAPSSCCRRSGSRCICRACRWTRCNPSWPEAAGAPSTPPPARCNRRCPWR